MSKKLFILCMVMVMLLPAYAEAKGKGRIITIMGNGTNCEEWLKDRAAQKADKHAFGPFMAISWVLGYLSALNKTSESGKDVLDGIDSSIVIDWIDNYCQNDPKKDPQKAAEALFEKLESGK